MPLSTKNPRHRHKIYNPQQERSILSILDSHIYYLLSTQNQPHTGYTPHNQARCLSKYGYFLEKWYLLWWVSET